MIQGAKVSGTITGISGTQYNVQDLEFDPVSYRFTGLYGQDVTNDIKRADKLLLVPDFNVTIENDRLSDELGSKSGLGLEPLPTNTAGILANQLLTDPLAAPLDALSNGFDKVVGNNGVRKIALLGFLGLAIWFVLKTSD